MTTFTPAALDPRLICQLYAIAESREMIRPELPFGGDVLLTEILTGYVRDHADELPDHLKP